MRILLLNQFYRPDTASTGQHLTDVADALAARGHEVHVVCSRRAYGGGPARFAVEEALGDVHVHRLPATGFGRASQLGRAADYLSFYALAWRRTMALPPMDVYVPLTTPPLIGCVAAAAARRRKARLVVWSMDLYPEAAVALSVLRRGGAAHRVLARAARRLYRRADRVISLGEVMTRRLIEGGAPPERIAEASIWVPGEVVHPVSVGASRARRRWAPGAAPVMMYSGNLGMGHELETAVRAVDRLRGSVDLRVLFVGDGKLRRPLERLVGALGLEGVSFHPPQPLEHLADGLAAGDFHLVAQREGMQGLILPGKIFGVLAAGRATLFIGPHDTEIAAILRESGAGVVVPPGDVAAAAEAIRRLCADPAATGEMGRRARACYEARFGRDRSVARMARLIEGATVT